MLSPYILLREAIKTFFLFRCQPGENLGTVPKFSPGNPKFQIPNLKQTPNLKFSTQNPFKDPNGEAETAQRRGLYGLDGPCLW
jgi:hypothetical protein